MTKINHKKTYVDILNTAKDCKDIPIKLLYSCYRTDINVYK